MTITPFGLIFITLGFTLLVVRPAWLLPLLIVSAVLHAFAVAIIGPAGPATPFVGLGITPWLFTCSLIFIHLVVIVIRNRLIAFGISRPVKLLFCGWMIFIGWCVLSTFTLPLVFEGTPVHALPYKDVGLNYPLQPLVWNRVHAIMAINSIIMGMLFIYVLQLNKDANINKRLMSGFIAAILVGISIGFYQWYWAIESWVSAGPFDLISQSLNPSYSSGYNGGRINWPFSEPSYASVWYSGVSIGGLAISLFTNSSWLGISVIVAGLSGLLSSRGGSGFAGFALGLIALCTILTVIIFRKNIPFKPILRSLALLTIFICLIVFSYRMAREIQPRLPNIYSSIESTFRPRIFGPIEARGQSNLDAFTITRDTWGFGAGLGSNRASSYLLSMMSNIGVPGLALFLILLAYQSYLIAFSPTTSNSLKALISGGTIGMFSGMIMGIPDLLLPAWWIWLIAGFGFIASRQHHRPVQSD